MSTTIVRRGALLAVLAVTATLLATGDLAAQGKKSDSVVKVTATATKPDADGHQTVTVMLNIDKPWHTYANPVGNMDLVNTQTTVKVAAAQPVELVKVNYPEGILKKDKVVGDYRIYEGTVTIKAQVKRTKGDTSPLEVSTFIQACNENTCLLQATVKTTVP
jgi:DsbC/DsbD-like thiol-disulfide interchange protein